MTKRKFTHNGKTFLLTKKQIFLAQTIQLKVWARSSIYFRTG